ncbi:MAG: YicC family protein [Syntrophaceae bacterium]|nr:YicC family protein [Syntrophaceae bacterium]
MQISGVESLNGYVKSMTGFGRSSATLDDVEIVTEVRAVNHRFLDIFIRVPKSYNSFEPQIRKIIAETSHRGKFEILVLRSGGRTGFTDVMLDYELAEKFHRMLLDLKDKLGLKGDITVSDMLSLKEIVVPVDRLESFDHEWPTVEKCLRQAMLSLEEMRRTEGAALWKDIEMRLESIRKSIDAIAPLVDQIGEDARIRLERRVKDLTGGLELDDDRMIQELALIAERSDITEELTRLESHVKQFQSFGREGSPLGRKLDFLLQELHREVNTLGSKSASTDISNHVVHMKAEVEKIREQTQNIE